MSAVEFVGPFEEWRVVVEGRQVPFLTADPVKGGRVDLTLDHRYGLVLDVATAEEVIPFIANAIAVAMGYTCHPPASQDDPVARLPFPRLSPIDADEGPE